MDKSVWKWKHNGDTALFAIHVDDIVTAPSSDSILEAFAERLRERFGEDRVTGGDEMTELLGIEIERDWTKKTIRLHQTAFVEKLLESFNGDRLKSTRNTPLNHNLEMEKWTGSPMRSFDYMRLVGSLNWLACSTRVDLSYATQLLSRYSNCPGPLQWDQATHVLEYLKGHASMGIVYHGSADALRDPYDCTDRVVAYVDSDHCGCKDSRRSTTGMIITLNRGPIVWKSKLQKGNKTSTAERSAPRS